MKKTNKAIISALCLILSGCVNLRQVNDFASNSYKGAQGFETLPVNFKQVCLDRCKEEDVKNGQLKEALCDCKPDSIADSADFLMYKALVAYLQGLEQLSANELTTYKFDSLANVLTSEQLTNAKITSAQAGAYSKAYSKLAGIISKAFTDGYRKNKIKIYIQGANEPLKEVVEYLKYNTSKNLSQELTIREGAVRGHYVSLVKNSHNDLYEQRKIVEEYYQFKAGLDNQIDQLKAYGRLLQVIADGHQKIAENLDKLDKAEMKEMIGQYASDIKDIRSQIQILSK